MIFHVVTAHIHISAISEPSDYRFSVITAHIPFEATSEPSDYRFNRITAHTQSLQIAGST